MRRFYPVIVLLLLSPIIGEVLLGSTPISKIYTLIPQIGLYGGGALLIREISRRWSLGWLSILLLGIVYGITEEGLIVSSIFDPHFPGKDALAGYGWLHGFNYVWAVAIIGYHAIWSVTIPIMLTELLFPKQSDKAWLGNFGLSAFGLLYVLSAILIRYALFDLTHFHFTAAQVIVTALVIVVLTVIAFFLPLPRQSAAARAIHTDAIGASVRAASFGFLFGAVWLGIFLLMFELAPSGFPPIVITAANVLVATGFVYLFVKMLPSFHISRYTQFAFAAGVLLVDPLAGMGVVYDPNDRLDMYGQLAVLILTIIGLILMRRKLARSGTAV
ncbi:hypothetical protein [Paenibacillus sp. SI8]|uniref:hypothetical protein n=1 Tax=unclassified Paenibacillus TaxID=185978 RepID=UPI003467AC41